ncbi:MAG: hypothetical protein ACTSVI_11605 [Promethearchaeota archaeon]
MLTCELIIYSEHPEVLKRAVEEIIGAMAASLKPLGNSQEVKRKIVKRRKFNETIELPANVNQ